MRFKQQGMIQVPMILATLLLFGAALGLWGLMNHWKKLTETQLRLDRCTGSAALLLKYTLSDVESGNQRILALRASIAAGTLLPPAQAPLRATLWLETLNQERLLLRWKTRQLAWLARRGCDGSHDLTMPLPDLLWRRLPPDTLGPQPLIWAGAMPRRFRIRLRNPPRNSVAQIATTGVALGKTWKAEWVSPAFRNELSWPGTP